MRMLVGVVAGFIAWLFVWLGAEMLLSAIWPEWFGAHQQAFQAAITNGAPFTPDSTILLIHIVSGSLIAAGAILRSASADPTDDVIVEGARTTAAMAASRFGPVLKVSEDGAMTFYDGVRVWDL